MRISYKMLSLQTSGLLQKTPSVFIRLVVAVLLVVVRPA